MPAASGSVVTGNSVKTHKDRQTGLRPSLSIQAPPVPRCARRTLVAGPPQYRAAPGNLFVLTPGTWFLPTIRARSTGIPCRSQSHLIRRASDSTSSGACQDTSFAGLSGLCGSAYPSTAMAMLSRLNS